MKSAPSLCSNLPTQSFPFSEKVFMPPFPQWQSDFQEDLNLRSWYRTRGTSFRIRQFRRRPAVPQAAPSEGPEAPTNSAAGCGSWTRHARCADGGDTVRQVRHRPPRPLSVFSSPPRPLRAAFWHPACRPLCAPPHLPRGAGSIRPRACVGTREARPRHLCRDAPLPSHAVRRLQQTHRGSRMLSPAASSRARAAPPGAGCFLCCCVCAAWAVCPVCCARCDPCAHCKTLRYTAHLPPRQVSFSTRWPCRKRAGSSVQSLLCV